MSTFKGRFNKILLHAVLIAFAIVMIYPLIWMFFCSLKTNDEIFSAQSMLPSQFMWDSYVKGWQGTIQYSFGVFFVNTFKLVVPTVLFTIVSSLVVGYGFSRFVFPFKRLLFMLMLSTLMLPNAVVLIPRYIIFRNLGWLDSYLPFTVPAILACNPFFVYLFVQFFRGIPRELDESAIVDGCNTFKTLIYILVPLSKAAIFTAGIFQFLWTWNDFLNVIVYINSVSKYTLSLGLRMALDAESGVNWNQVLAMAVVTMLPPLMIFFAAQRYFVEGIATTGLKG